MPGPPSPPRKGFSPSRRPRTRGTASSPDPVATAVPEVVWVDGGLPAARPPLVSKEFLPRWKESFEKEQRGYGGAKQLCDDVGRALHAVSPRPVERTETPTGSPTAAPKAVKPDKGRTAVAVALTEDILSKFERYGPLFRELTGHLRRAVYVDPKKKATTPKASQTCAVDTKAMANAVFGWVSPTRKGLKPVDENEPPTAEVPAEEVDDDDLMKAATALLSPTGAPTRVPSSMSVASMASHVFRGTRRESSGEAAGEGGIHPSVRQLARTRTHFDEVKLLRRELKGLHAHAHAVKLTRFALVNIIRTTRTVVVTSLRRSKTFLLQHHFHSWRRWHRRERQRRKIMNAMLGFIGANGVMRVSFIMWKAFVQRQHVLHVHDDVATLQKDIDGLSARKADLSKTLELTRTEFTRLSSESSRLAASAGTVETQIEASLDRLEDDPENRMRVMTSAWAALADEVIVDILNKCRRLLWGLGSPCDFEGFQAFGARAGAGMAATATSRMAGLEPQGHETMVNPMLLLTREERSAVLGEAAAAGSRTKCAPESVYQLPFEEAAALKQLQSLPIMSLVLRWVNYQLLRPADAPDDRWCMQPVLNLCNDLKDSSVYAALLHRLSTSANTRPPPNMRPPAKVVPKGFAVAHAKTIDVTHEHMATLPPIFPHGLRHADNVERAGEVLERLRRMHAPPFINTAEGIAKGSSDLNMATMAYLMCRLPELRQPDKDVNMSHAGRLGVELFPVDGMRWQPGLVPPPMEHSGGPRVPPGTDEAVAAMKPLLNDGGLTLPRASPQSVVEVATAEMAVGDDTAFSQQDTLMRVLMTVERLALDWSRIRDKFFKRPDQLDLSAIESAWACLSSVHSTIKAASETRRARLQMWTSLRSHIQTAAWSVIKQRLEMVPFVFKDHRELALREVFTKLAVTRVHKLKEFLNKVQLKPGTDVARAQARVDQANANQIKAVEAFLDTNYDKLRMLFEHCMGGLCAGTDREAEWSVTWLQFVSLLRRCRLLKEEEDVSPSGSSMSTPRTMTMAMAASQRPIQDAMTMDRAKAVFVESYDPVEGPFGRQGSRVQAADALDAVEMYELTPASFVEALIRTAGTVCVQARKRFLEMERQKALKQSVHADSGKVMSPRDGVAVSTLRRRRATAHAGASTGGPLAFCAAVALPDRVEAVWTQLLFPHMTTMVTQRNTTVAARTAVLQPLLAHHDASLKLLYYNGNLPSAAVLTRAEVLEQARVREEAALLGLDITMKALESSRGSPMTVGRLVRMARATKWVPDCLSPQEFQTLFERILEEFGAEVGTLRDVVWDAALLRLLRGTQPGSGGDKKRRQGSRLRKQKSPRAGTAPLTPVATGSITLGTEVSFVSMVQMLIGVAMYRTPDPFTKVEVKVGSLLQEAVQAFEAGAFR